MTCCYHFNSHVFPALSPNTALCHHTNLHLDSVRLVVRSAAFQSYLASPKKKTKPHLKFDRLTPIKTSRYQINRFERFGALQKITALKELLCSWQLCDNFDIESKALSLHCCTSWLTASTEASKSSWLANATPTDHHFFGSCVLWWLKDSKMKWMNKIRLMNGEHK